MNIIELAIKHGDYSVEHGIDGVQFTNKELIRFAQAVIEDYKAGLAPVAWMTKDNFFNHVKTEHYAIPLYALPSGETK